MASSVTVLAPNGRRQTVKCTPNTTLLQIIEEVCKKQGFKTEEYDIKHHNKVLDTTTTFRFSGLPNNAQLELATAVKARIDSNVILAVNLENGNRLTGEFQPDDSLMNVLERLCPDIVKSNEHLVVIYTRREICKDDLQATTLRSLGLRGGRAMLRLVQKNPDDLKTQANVSAPLPSKPAEEKPYKRILKTDEASHLVEGSSRENDSPPKSVQKKVELDYMKMAREKRKLAASSPVRKNENEPTKQAKTEFSDAMDVDVDSPKPTAQSSSGSLDQSSGGPPSPDVNFVFLGERNAMLFSSETAKSVPSDDLPDDFFELTIDDAKKIIHDIRRKRSDMENGVLMTAEMRNLEESKKQLRQLQKYKKAIIRIQFPNRVILQGVFKPTETIRDVADFVREYLGNRSVPFYLYVTPPKQVLSEDSHLIETGCVPSAILFLGCKDSKDLDEIRLKPEYTDQFTTNSIASLAASRMRTDFTRNVHQSDDNSMEDPEMDSVSNPDVPGPSTSSAPESYARKIDRGKETTGKVPRWFKPSK